MTKDYTSTEKVLKEPVFIELSDYARKVKNSLVFSSTLGIGLSFTSILVSKDSTILGIQLENFSHKHVQVLLLLLIIYFGIQYIWVVLDNFIEWRLRITGTKTTFSTGATYGSVDADYPVDPRQSSLYNWWYSQHKELASLHDATSRIKSLEASLLQKSKKYPENTIDIQASLLELNDNLRIYNENSRHIERVVNSDRIPVSLMRFDNWYKLFIQSQNARWFVIDFSFPVAISLLAIFGLYYNLR
ncbi:MAG: hypothetical protein B6D73_14280 [gamma proteobacterium symbiont of Stewartia floridana]|nr:MAG: hypothetical protein B6D73_14280 [gamma proteobacterium symbiont of Stewartia floridana]